MSENLSQSSLITKIEKVLRMLKYLFTKSKRHTIKNIITQWYNKINNILYPKFEILSLVVSVFSIVLIISNF